MPGRRSGHTCSDAANSPEDDGRSAAISPLRIGPGQDAQGGERNGALKTTLRNDSSGGNGRGPEQRIVARRAPPTGASSRTFPRPEPRGAGHGRRGPRPGASRYRRLRGERPAALGHMAALTVDDASGMPLWSSRSTEAGRRGLGRTVGSPRRRRRRGSWTASSQARAIQAARPRGRAPRRRAPRPSEAAGARAGPKRPSRSHQPRLGPFLPTSPSADQTACPSSRPAADVQDQAALGPRDPLKRRDRRRYDGCRPSRGKPRPAQGAQSPGRRGRGGASISRGRAGVAHTGQAARRDGRATTADVGPGRVTTKDGEPLRQRRAINRRREEGSGAERANKARPEGKAAASPAEAQPIEPSAEAGSGGELGGKWPRSSSQANGCRGRCRRHGRDEGSWAWERRAKMATTGGHPLSCPRRGTAIQAL